MICSKIKVIALLAVGLLSTAQARKLSFNQLTREHVKRRVKYGGVTFRISSLYTPNEGSGSVQMSVVKGKSMLTPQEIKKTFKSLPAEEVPGKRLWQGWYLTVTFDEESAKNVPAFDLRRTIKKRTSTLPAPKPDAKPSFLNFGLRSAKNNRTSTLGAPEPKAKPSFLKKVEARRRRRQERENKTKERIRKAKLNAAKDLLKSSKTWKAGVISRGIRRKIEERKEKQRQKEDNEMKSMLEKLMFTDSEDVFRVVIRKGHEYEGQEGIVTGKHSDEDSYVILLDNGVKTHAGYKFLKLCESDTNDIKFKLDGKENSGVVEHRDELFNELWIRMDNGKIFVINQENLKMSHWQDEATVFCNVTDVQDNQ